MLYLEKIDLAENFISTLPAYLFNNSINIRDINLAFNDFRMLTDNCFSGLNRGRIILSYNSIEKMDYDAFNGILNSLEYLDLDHNNLQRIPEGIRRLHGLKYLYISSNLLKDIDPTAFDNFAPSLRALSLSGNQLVEIPSTALQNCTKLSHFNIAFNEIVEIEEGTFQNWGSTIKSLVLSNNRLIKLSNNIFDGMEELNELSLSFNPLRFIEKDAFAGLTKLESFELSFGFEENELNYEIFDPMVSLKGLSLDHNNIVSIYPSSFLLPELMYLNLESNKIRAIPKTFLKAHVHSKLQDIRFSDNELTVIETGTFRALLNLETVLLSNNKIRNIEKQSFSDLPKLNTVILSHNRLSDIRRDAFTNLQAIGKIILSYKSSFQLIATSPYLQWLYLRGNHIKLIPQYTLPTMLYLEKIDLAENFISTLPAYLFNNSINIRDINLAFNDFRMLTDNCFSGLNTGRIILSYNSIEKMDYDAFNGILNSLEYLDLDHNNLQRIPEGIRRLQALKYLYISSNLLKDIDPTAFDNFAPSLRALSLSGNQLVEIPSTALQNCTKLSHFNIAFNEIVEIEEGTFQNWGSTIKSLVLSNNRLIKLSNNIFDGMEELNELSLSFNPLRFIEKDAFAGLTKLESFELSFGFEENELNYEIFDPMVSLKGLSLDHNNIVSIYPSSFLLPELMYLNLESNKIRAIPKTFLKANVHSKLQDIRFSDNELTVIETGTFRALLNLETILLSNNKIRIIEKQSFSDLDLSKLNTVILSHNRLSDISRDAFTNLQAIGKIDFYNNLLSEVSFTFFTNISGVLHLNFSRNQIVSCVSDSRVLNIQVFDLRYNNLDKIPVCIEKTSALRKLYLDFNIVNNLDHSVFMHLTSLEYLGLQQNNIKSVKKKAFFGLQNLQSLDLSKNFINQLHIGQFANMSKLRILNLSGNHLSYLPKEIFKSTHIEMLDLSFNLFSVVPSTSLSDIGISLRHFSMRSNNIEHIDITTFPDIPLLQHLDLGNNKLTILPDNVFTSLGLLQTLDLSFNPLRSNFKELFHYAQGLKFLNLANTGMIVTPHFPLPDLIFLNLSYNSIETINKNSVQQLSNLKTLDLSHNNLLQVPSQLWMHLPNLKTLELSYNPIKELLFDNFINLQSLQELNIQHLNSLSRFESEAITQLKILSKLSMQTWPKIENFSERLCQMLSNIDQLRVLRILVIETELTDQLLCITNRKIRLLELTGRNLKIVNKDAFARFTKNPELTIKLHGTQIEELPSGLFSNMFKIAHLTLDLRNNMLTHLHPEIFYGNSSRWKNVGTTLISGGLFLSNNPFRCGCHLSWLSHWLRRWTRESLQSHNSPIEAVIKMNEVIKESTCVDSVTGTRIPIVDLEPEDMSCHASALSNGTYSNNASVIFVILLIIIKFVR
uniref:Chaoptin-like n=1 Tax=Diabrotica virgifera virgifera TaxID=50390 RepID=A0A6P7FU58_DIAVI